MVYYVSTCSLTSIKYVNPQANCSHLRYPETPGGTNSVLRTYQHLTEKQLCTSPRKRATLVPCHNQTIVGTYTNGKVHCLTTKQLSIENDVCECDSSKRVHTCTCIHVCTSSVNLRNYALLTSSPGYARSPPYSRGVDVLFSVYLSHVRSTYGERSAMVSAGPKPVCHIWTRPHHKGRPHV